MKTLVIVNPLSHGGRAARQWKRFQKMLPEADFIVTSDMNQARNAVMTASCDTVVACGGDGTVCAIADGVLNHPNEAMKFGVLYSGTSPDFCTFHHIPIRPDDAVSCLRTGFSRPVSVLQANGHCFFCSSNIGLGADVAQTANRLRPLCGDVAGTLAALLKHLWNHHAFSVTINGLQLKNCDHLIVTRMPLIASGLKLSLPMLRDDEFALWSIQHLSFWKWLAMIPRFYRGLPCGNIQICRNSLTIRSDSPVSLEFDGDPHGALPVTFSFAKRHLNLIVPPSET